MKTFRGFALAAAALALVIAVLGSWVRINGAGLTCPDWPLCKGALVPALQGGVVLEWSHRLAAFAESFVVLGAIVAGWRVRREIPGLTAALGALGGVFALQVVLGGATVLLSNSPLSVALHWGAGMALLATLVVLATLSLAAGRPRPASGAFVPLVATASVAYVTMCVGAFVSSSYAGLACPSLPACGDGTLFGSNGAQFVQMLHRWLAVATMLGASWSAVSVAGAGVRARVAAYAGCGLVFVQAGLGVANVMLALPTFLREAHAANAALTFVAFTVAAACAARERSASPAAARAGISRVAQRA